MEIASALRSLQLARQIPLEYLPHIAQDPVTVITAFDSLVGEIRLVMFDPCVCFVPAEMQVHLSNLCHKAVRAQVAIAFWIKL